MQYWVGGNAAIDPQMLAAAIDRDMRALAGAPGEGVAAAVDRAFRRQVDLPPSGWAAAYWHWLWRLDGLRLEAYRRIGWTLLLALGCLGLGGLLALQWARRGAPLVRRFSQRAPAWLPVQLCRGGVFYLLGAFPAYALVFLLADLLKHLQWGGWPLAVAAVAALAVGDGVLVATLDNGRQIRRRLAGRDFMEGVRARLSPGAFESFLDRLVLIDLLPYVLVRLAVVVGSIVVVGIVPGIYPGTLGGYLNLHDPHIWLRHSLDILWVLTAVLVCGGALLEGLRAQLQRDRKGIDRVEQIWSEAPAVELAWRQSGLSLLGLIGCSGLVAWLHWRADWFEVARHLGLTLAEIGLAGVVGLSVAVLLGALAPLYAPGLSALLLQLLEAVPRVIGVAFLMTAYNLWAPAGGDFGRWAVWSVLLGLFCSGEIVRSLYSHTAFLRQVDFVAGLQALGMGRSRLFRLHIWPQIKYQIYHGIYPLVRAIVFCEGAICILRFAMQGAVIRLYPLGSLLAEGAEHFTFDTAGGLAFGLGVVVLMALCIEAASQVLRQGWRLLFLKGT
ncbi:MAG: hypothetical protein GKR89_15845 [Candidatus Latescibacteria bacterium]|nr:hypothetical protein [Candidatus Latescibacterota bacterium]